MADTCERCWEEKDDVHYPDEEHDHVCTDCFFDKIDQAERRNDQ